MREEFQAIMPAQKKSSEKAQLGGEKPLRKVADGKRKEQKEVLRVQMPAT